MGKFGYYLKYDIRHLIKRKTTIYFYILLFITVIIDTIFTYWTQSKYFEDLSEMSAAWYVFLENSASIIRSFYFSFIPILAVLPFGLQYYHEKSSKYREYLLCRGSRRSYYLSKFFVSFMVGFITIFSFLILNYIIVHLIYPNHSILGGTFLRPDNGAFLENIFYRSVNLYQFIYIIINSLIAGIISLLSLSLSMLISYKNGFLVIAVPFIIYTIQSVFLFFLNVHYDIMHIIQPATRYALVDPITTDNVLVSILLWFFLAVILFVIGYRKDRDIL